jgi:Domain of unknown function (DUF6436)
MFPSSLRLHPPAAGTVAWAAILVWLLGTFGAFWLFELHNWQPFDNQPARLFEVGDPAQTQLWFNAHFDVEANAVDGARLTFVQLYNPDCRCDASTESDLKRLMARYQSRGVRFVAALTPAPLNRPPPPHPLGLRVITASDDYLAHSGINIAPSALIFDGAGRILYYGPFSESEWCGSNGSLADAVIDRALAGQAPFSVLPVVRGCFCAW